jgi:hypothetical protein
MSLINYQNNVYVGLLYIYIVLVLHFQTILILLISYVCYFKKVKNYTTIFGIIITLLLRLLRILCSLLFCDSVILYVTVFFCVLYCSLFLYCIVSACDVCAATLTEVFPCFFLSCKANGRV